MWSTYPLVRIWKTLCHSGPGCSFVRVLHAAYFPVKHSCLYNKSKYHSLHTLVWLILAAFVSKSSSFSDTPSFSWSSSASFSSPSCETWQRSSREQNGKAKAVARTKHWYSLVRMRPWQPTLCTKVGWHAPSTVKTCRARNTVPWSILTVLSKCVGFTRQRDPPGHLRRPTSIRRRPTSVRRQPTRRLCRCRRHSPSPLRKIHTSSAELHYKLSAKVRKLWNEPGVWRWGDGGGDSSGRRGLGSMGVGGNLGGRGGKGAIVKVDEWKATATVVRGAGVHYFATSAFCLLRFAFRVLSFAFCLLCFAFRVWSCTSYRINKPWLEGRPWKGSSCVNFDLAVPLPRPYFELLVLAPLHQAPTKRRLHSIQQRGPVFYE